MFSGKSTELIRKIRVLKSINKKILVIKPKIDNRYESDKIVSHNKESENCLIIELNEIPDITVQKYDIIVIDEGQFFSNLKKMVLHWVEKLNMHVIIGGLDGDYKREPIGEILSLIPYADDYIKLKSMCKSCNDGTPAIFTKRLSNEHEQILIGSNDLYVPLCRYHYCLSN
jgi:thymidine kinase